MCEDLRLERIYMMGGFLVTKNLVTNILVTDNLVTNYLVT